MSSNALLSKTKTVKCSAQAGNGSKCSATCQDDELCQCTSGAKGCVCSCLPSPPPPSGDDGFILTSFAPGERDYFTYGLTPFILSLGSQQAIDLVDALNLVIAAVDVLDPIAYNMAEHNYVVKKEALSEIELESYNNWVELNGFYH